MFSDPKNSFFNATRVSLLSRAKRREADAWRDLVDLYAPLIAHWCQRCRLDSHETADVIQEVFSSVSQSLIRFQPRGESGAFRGWLWTITANKIKDEFRRHGRRLAKGRGGSTALHSMRNLTESGANPDETEPSSVEEVQRLIGRALDQIRDDFESKTWAIFERSIYDRLPSQMVAEEFKVSAATVRQIRSRILRRLRKQLGDIVD